MKTPFTATLDTNDGDMTVSATLDAGGVDRVGIVALHVTTRTPVPIDRMAEVTGHLMTMLRGAVLDSIGQQLRDEIDEVESNAPAEG